MNFQQSKHKIYCSFELQLPASVKPLKVDKIVLSFKCTGLLHATNKVLKCQKPRESWNTWISKKIQF